MRVQRLTIGLALGLVAASLFVVFYFNLYRGGAANERNIVVILRSTNVRSDFWQTVASGAEAAAKEAGARLEVQGPLKDTDAATQTELLDEALTSKPDAIVIAPVGDELETRLLGRVQEAGIKLVVLDTPVTMAREPVTVSGNHREAGRMAGELALAEKSGAKAQEQGQGQEEGRTAGQTEGQAKDQGQEKGQEKGQAEGLAKEQAAERGPGRVAILSDYENSPVSAEREAGIRSVVPADRDGGTAFVGDSEDQAYAATRTILAAAEPASAVVAFNEQAALGAAKAIKEAGRTGAVKLIAFDSSIYEIKLLEDGALDAMIVQKPFNIGYLGVKNALRQLDRKRTEPRTYIDSIVVTKDNMYSPENQKLLFPFK